MPEVFIMDNCCGCGSSTYKVWQLFQTVFRSPLKGGDGEYYDTLTLQVTVHRLSGSVTFTRIWEWDHRANLFRILSDFSGGLSAVEASIAACAAERSVPVIYNSAWTASNNTTWTASGAGEGGTPSIYSVTATISSIETVPKLRGMVGREDWVWSSFEALGEGIFSRHYCWDEGTSGYTTSARVPSLDPFSWYAWSEKEIRLSNGMGGYTYYYHDLVAGSWWWTNDLNLWDNDATQYVRTSGVVELAAVRIYKATTWCQAFWTHDELLPQSSGYNTTGGATCGWELAMDNPVLRTCWKYPPTADQQATVDSDLIEASSGAFADPYFTIYPPESTLGYVKVFAPDWLAWASYGFGTPPAWVTDCGPCAT